MFVHTITPSTTIRNNSYGGSTYTTPVDNDPTLVELIPSDKVPQSNTLFGIKPAFRLCAEREVKADHFVFYRNKVDVLAGEIPAHMTARRAGEITKNINACIAYGNPGIILLYGEDERYLDILSVTFNRKGYRGQTEKTKGKYYFAATRSDISFSFPKNCESETMLGARLRRAFISSRPAMPVRGRFYV